MLEQLNFLIKTMFNELSIGRVPEENKGKEIHPERKLSEEQEEKLQETKEVFDKQCQFIMNGLKNNKTLPDFYKDSSDKLDEILEGVDRESDDPEIINNLVEAVNFSRKIFIDHLSNKSNADFFDAVDNAKSEKGEKLKTGKVESNNPEECINSILNGEIDYQKTKEELEQADKEITGMMDKMTTKPLAFQYRIARDFLREAEKGNESEKIVYTAMAKNALENYKIMIQNLDMRKVLNIDSAAKPIFETDKLEEELKKLIGKEEEEKRGGNEEGIKEAREKIEEIKLDENKKQEIKELEKRKGELLEYDEKLEVAYVEITKSKTFKTANMLFKLKNRGIDYETARAQRSDVKPLLPRIGEIDRMRFDIRGKLEKINKKIEEIKKS